MPKRTTNSPGTKAVSVVMLVALLGVGVFAAYVKLTPAAQRVPDEIRRTVDVKGPPVRHIDPVTRPAPKGPDVDIDQKPQLMVASLDGDTVKLLPAKGTPKGETPMVFVANETLKNFKIADARALGVEVKDRVAVVDFNPALDAGFGSMEEGNLLKALQMAMGQFKEIDGFQIRIEGTIVDSLGGHIELETPIPVIRPGKSEPDAGSSTTPSEDPASAG